MAKLNLDQEDPRRGWNLLLRAQLAEMIAAWFSTSPPGHIGTVFDAMVAEQGAFWNPLYFKAKVRTPIEYVNATLRALDADADGTEPWAAVIKKNDATSDPDHTRALVEAGFFVSSNISDGPEDTQAEGAAHLAASLEAGAQVLKVDRAMPADGWSSEIPGGAPARCNPVTAPADCSAAELESLYP